MDDAARGAYPLSPHREWWSGVSATPPSLITSRWNVPRGEPLGRAGPHVVSNPLKPPRRFVTTVGSNGPARSRGTAKALGPCSVCPVFGRRPVRALSDFEAGRACGASPRGVVNSAVRARSSTQFVRPVHHPCAPRISSGDSPPSTPSSNTASGFVSCVVINPTLLSRRGMRTSDTLHLTRSCPGLSR